MRNKVEITERMVLIHHCSKQSQTVEYEKPRKNVYFLHWSGAFFLPLFLKLTSGQRNLEKSPKRGLRHGIWDGTGKGTKGWLWRFFPYAPDIIIDLHVFYFHSEPELPTRYGICLNFNEWQCFQQKHSKITNGSTRINVDRMKPIIHEILKEKVSEMPRKIVTDVLSTIPVKKSIWI